MDLTTVKAEIKTWEHDFRVQNGRSATVEDIKALPMIAEKYKLYKRLTKKADQSKGKAKASQTQVPEPPRTPPPRRQHAPSDAAPAAILPKSRPIVPAADATSKNPFSPVKKTQSTSAEPNTSTNPFLTPIKATRTPSPDPFAPTQDTHPPAAQQNAAIVKARKRLRGESVSPSPQPRDKRRRANGLDPPVYDRLSQPQSVSPQDPQVEEGDSFVDDSPVKAPTGGKTFKPLFEEAMSLSQPTASRASSTTAVRGFSRAKTVPGGLFGTAKKGTNGVQMTLETVFDSQGAAKPTRVAKVNNTDKGKGKEEDRPIDGVQKVKKRKVLPGPKGLIPGKDDLFENPPPATTSSHKTSTSRKRTMSKVAEDENNDTRLMSNTWGLLPPSPPPQQDDAGRYNPKGKGKAKARDAIQRKIKKAKLSATEQDEDEDEDVEDEMSSSDGVEVKTIAWRGRPNSLSQDENDLALAVDPELQQFHLRTRPSDARARSASPRSEKFEVDLPEEMQRVLALSPRDVDREKEEEDLVKGLMRGRRRGGGEVWGPGEIGGESEASDEGAMRGMEEDDWEGEGVPWEVAEL